MELTRAAVLVPLHVDTVGECHVTLIRRTSAVSHHQGQVALPGGRYEAACDESLAGTALREAEEELGLAPADVVLLGVLPDRCTLTSRHLVSPFVGRIPFPYAFAPDACEVARVFALPLRCFTALERREEREWTHAGQSYRVPCVRAAGEVVWGMTLAIIDDLLVSGLGELGHGPAQE